MNYQLLKTLVVGMSGTDEVIAATINTKDIPATQNIQVADIKKYLIVTGKILSIKASTDPAALLTMEALNSFAEFIMSDAANVAALNAQMDGLVAASLLTAADKTAILALGDTLESLADQNNLGVVRAGDIQYARTL